MVLECFGALSEFYCFKNKCMTMNSTYHLSGYQNSLLRDHDSDTFEPFE